MKSTKPVLFLALIVFAVLTGCGKSNSSNTAAVPGSTFPNSNYPAGQYPNGQYPYSGQGPMALQGQGSDGTMVLNSSGSGQQGIVGGVQSSCAPITSQIPLQGTMYLDSANIIAGQGVSGNTYAQGYLQLSPLLIQTIMYKIGSYYGNQAPCATIVGMNVGHYNTKIYGGYVLIMLNNNPSLTTQVYF